MIKKLKKIVIGSPLPNWEYKHQRLSKKLALAVFSSDSLSSVAYATEEILIVLVAAGTAFLWYSFPISIIILGLLWVLIISYGQTIQAYPKGGGAYSVAKENLGKYPGLVAASSLLLDYILTAAVSIAAGVAALTSAFPALFEYRILLGIGALILMTLLNLKGVKESGLIFSIPAYIFIISFMVMVATGFFRYVTGTIQPMPTDNIAPITGLSLFLLLRAFSSGCTALTGIEAVSNGVPAFKTPEPKNARITLFVMALLLSTLFIGITFLALQYKITPLHDRTVVSVLAEQIFGRGFSFYVIQAFTMLILFLAANTSFAGFPRLSFFLAKDKYLPRQFMQLGDKLVFSTGIIFLGISSSLLLILFGGSVHRLIPLYAVGVFTSFTLSQLGMIKRNWTLRPGNWKKAMTINTIGAFMTLVAVIIIAYTKFLTGAWIILILIPLFVYIFNKIHSHYEDLAEQLSVSELKTPLKFKTKKHMIVVLVPSFHRGIIKAISFAKTFCKRVEAVHIDISGTERDKLVEKWHKFKPGIKLVIIKSPYRVLLRKFLDYLDILELEQNYEVIVVIPEFVPKKFWHRFLHNQTGLALRKALHTRKNTSYISVQYHLEK